LFLRQPVGDRDFEYFGFLGFEGEVQGGFDGGFGGGALELVEERLAVGLGHEEFGLLLALVHGLGHHEGVLVDLEAGRLADRDLDGVDLQLPEPLLLALLGLDLRLQHPVFRAVVLDLDLLDLRRADRGVKLEPLGGVVGLADALAHDGELLRDRLLEVEFDAGELDAVLRLLGVERDLEVEVGLRLQHALLGRDGDHVALLVLLPALAHGRVAQVVHLDALRVRGLHHHRAELQHVVHQLHLRRLARARERGQEARLVALGLDQHLGHEARHAVLRLELEVDVERALGLDLGLGRVHGQELVAELAFLGLRQLHVERDLALVHERDAARDLSADLRLLEVHIFHVIAQQLVHQRHALPADFHGRLVDFVEHEFELFLDLARLVGHERDGDLERAAGQDADAGHDVHVELRLAHEVGLDLHGHGVVVGDAQDLGGRHWVLGHRAQPEVELVRVEADVGLLHAGLEPYVEARAADDLELDLRARERGVLGLEHDLHLLGGAGLDGALVRQDLHGVLLELVLLGEVEVEVELALVLDGERADLLHAHLDLALVERVGLLLAELEALVRDDVLVQVEAGALHVDQDRLGLALHVADQVLVLVGLGARPEGDAHLAGRVGPHDAAHGRDVQAVLLARLALDALVREVERDRDVVLVEQLDLLHALGVQQQRVEVEARHVEHDLGLDHLADQLELALDAHRADAEHPRRDVDPRRLGRICELHFVLLARHDQPARLLALELVRVERDRVLRLLFPVELVLLVGRVEHLEPLHVLHLGADALDVHDVAARRHLDLHVLEFLDQLAGLEFEVADRPLGGALDEDAERLGVLALDVDVQLALADVDFGGVELERDVDLRVGLDEPGLVVGAEGLEAGVVVLVLHDHVVVDRDGLGVGEREVVGARGLHHGRLELDDLEVGLDLDLVAARVDQQLQVAHVVRQLDLRLGLDLLLGDVAGLVGVEGRLLLLDFGALGRRLGLALDLLRLLGVLRLLEQPLVLALADVADVDHGVVPVFRDVGDADRGQLQVGVGQLHRLVREELDVDLLGRVGRELAHAREERDALVFVARGVVGPRELEPVFAVVDHREIDCLLGVDPAVAEIQRVFGVFRQVVEQHFVFEGDAG